MHTLKQNRAAFTLPEVLIVLSTLSLLAALLLPVFQTARGAARQAACVSNLRQIGHALFMYLQDNDGRYPIAVDPVDRFISSSWRQRAPEFSAQMGSLPLISQVLAPYTSAALFRCPADVGFEYPDVRVAPPKMDALPTCYEKFAMSYTYRTGLAAFRHSEFSIVEPTQVNVMHDAVGFWHGRMTPIELRFNVLFADGHAKNIPREQLGRIWLKPLPGDPSPDDRQL